MQKLLSQAGIASRREAEQWMEQGRVRVNGVVVREFGARIDPDRDVVEVDGKRVAARARIRWIAFHKPMDAITTRADKHGGRTVYDLLPPELRPLHYVGRLDRDTEGLLLLSNDGDLSHVLMHPSSEVEREYHAGVEGRPADDVLARITTGVELDDGPARAQRARRLPDDPAGGVLAIVLVEGRNREVRRLMEAVGHPVRWLRRVRFGPIRLGDLALGAWRDLTPQEIEELRASAPAR